MCASGETNLPTFSVEQPLYVKWLAPGISAQSIITKVRILIPVTLFLKIFFLFACSIALCSNYFCNIHVSWFLLEL